MKRFLLYLLRWQLSSPILAVVIYLITDKIIATIIANLVGGCVFFWVDKFIFTSKILSPIWEVKNNVVCCDCNKVGRGYRIVKANGYDKTNDPSPKYRCESCSDKKAKEIL